MKPKLLIVELWGLGDLVIATPFIRVAAEKFDVTVMAKPYAHDLQERFWPGVKVIPFLAPWTAFKLRDKYRLWQWPWIEFYRLRKLLKGQFDVGLSARWGDPRDHFLLALVQTKRRLGFPRIGSQILLTDRMQRPSPLSHRYEYWRTLGNSLGLKLPPREHVFVAREGKAPVHRQILIHTGAGQPVRVWPLERYQRLAQHFRQKGFAVRVACDSDQRQWWLQAGETQVTTPRDVAELMLLIDEAGVFLGNDSGPGHLAALMGIPTFTLFGPQLPEWFSPMHPASEYVEGKPCPFKPCSDYCRFPLPICLHRISEEEILGRVEAFVSRNIGTSTVRGR